jgi:hypothetical protein
VDPDRAYQVLLVQTASAEVLVKTQVVAAAEQINLRQSAELVALE